MNILIPEIVYGKINLVDPASKPLTPPAVKAHRRLIAASRCSCSSPLVPSNHMPCTCSFHCLQRKSQRQYTQARHAKGMWLLQWSSR